MPDTRVMTPQRVRDCVRDIEQKRGDHEAAHGAEDSLYYDILWCIANNAIVDMRECAKEAIKTKDIAFCRWCA